MSVLPEKCHTWYLWGADSKPDLKFCFMANLGQKRQSCPFYLKIDTRSIFEVLIPKLHWDFRNSDLKIHFWPIWAEWVKNFHFSWKLAYMVSWKKWFENKTLIFKIRVPKLIFGQFWTEKAFPVYSYFLRPCCFFSTYS